MQIEIRLLARPEMGLKPVKHDGIWEGELDYEWEWSVVNLSFSASTLRGIGVDVIAKGSCVGAQYAIKEAQFSYDTLKRVTQSQETIRVAVELGNEAEPDAVVALEEKTE